MRRLVLCLALFLLPLLVFTQTEKPASEPSAAKGVRPVNQSTNQLINQTRAVVIGISDYQDKDIPDLRFADRDAEAFANFLRSPGGRSTGWRPPETAHK